MKKYWPAILLTLIIAFAFAIRLFRLNLDIPTIYGDEAGGHYLALKTLIQPSDLIHKIYYFLQNGTATYAWIFGLTPLGVRLPTAIYGTVIVLLVYFFVKNIADKKTALLASLIVSISPWNFMLSRIGHPHVLLMIIFSILSITIYLRSDKKRNVLLSLIFLGLAVFEYPSMVVIAPIIALLLLAQNVKKQILLPIIIFIGLSASMYIFLYRGLSIGSRGLDLAIWRDINVTADNNLYRGIAGENAVSKIFYNLPMSVIGTFVKNYLYFFSPDFLFLKGDPILRHSTGQVGVFLPFMLPFMFFGVYKFFCETNKKTRNYILMWIVASPIPASITSDGAGYLLRVLTLMPILTYFVALGITKIYGILKRLLFKMVFVMLLLAVCVYSTGSFLYGYYFVYPTLSAKSFEVGFKGLSNFQQANNNASMLIVWHGYYPDFVFRFWQRTPFNDFDKFVSNDLPLGRSIFKQTYSNLYLGWPEDEADLDRALKIIKPTFLAVPGSYSYETSKDPVEIIQYPNKTTSFSVYKVNN